MQIIPMTSQSQQAGDVVETGAWDKRAAQESQGNNQKQKETISWT
jgi:hypothetical protein